MDNYFAALNGINVNGKTEKKNGLTYLSWAFAWGEVKKLYPDSTYTVYENKDGLFYHTDGRTAWVKTGVTVNGIEHIEYLPVMDHRNKSIALDSITSFDVNKTIQRSLTKAVARHGLGLYIYAGEDLPENEAEIAGKPAAIATDPGTRHVCTDCGSIITPTAKKDGSVWPAYEVAEYSTRRFGRKLCPACQKKAFEAEKVANPA